MEPGISGKCLFKVIAVQGLNFIIPVPAEIILVRLDKPLSLVQFLRFILVIDIEICSIHNLVDFIIKKSIIFVITTAIAEYLVSVKSMLFSFVNNISM